MACYVDKISDWGWHEGPSCRLVADQLEELHALAERLGIRRAWFQDVRTLKRQRPHYLLTASRRERAVRLGAIEVTKKKLEEIWKHAEAVRRITEEREAMREGDDAPVDGRWTL